MVIDVVRGHRRFGRHGERRESAARVGAPRVALVERRIRARGGETARATALGGSQAHVVGHGERDAHAVGRARRGDGVLLHVSAFSGLWEARGDATLEVGDDL